MIVDHAERYRRPSARRTSRPIQTWAGWARHDSFDPRGCSGLAMPLPRLQKSRRPCSCGRPVIHDLCARHTRLPPADDRQFARSCFPPDETEEL
jgi:hypothetical protein